MNADQLKSDGIVLLKSQVINDKLSVNVYESEQEPKEMYVGIMHHKFTEEVLLKRQSLEEILDFVVDVALENK